MTRPHLLLAVCLAVLALPAARVAAQDDDAGTTDYTRVRWETYREAQARARAESKPLLLDFSAPGDTYCARMQRETWTDRRVIHFLNDHFAMARIDTERLPAMARKFGVKGLPTVWFLDEAGKRLTHTDGFVSADNLIPLLQFVAARDYEWTDYSTWLEHRK